MDSLPLVRTWRNQGGRRKALSVVIQSSEPSKQLCYFLSPCPWCMFLQEIISWTPPPGLSQPVLARCSFVIRVKSRRGPSYHLFIGLSLTPLLMLKASAGHFSPGLLKMSARVIVVFSQTLCPLDEAQYVITPLAFSWDRALVPYLPTLSFYLFTPIVTGALLILSCFAVLQMLVCKTWTVSFSPNMWAKRFLTYNLGHTRPPPG